MDSLEIDDSKVISLVICGLALLFAIPFHVILIVVLVRYRKINAFSFPFFHMLLSLSINDLIAAIMNGISFSLFILPPKIIVQLTNPWFGIIQTVFYGFGIAGDCIMLVAIGISRLVAYVFSLKSIWHPVHTKIAIALQWTYAVSFGLAGIPTGMHATYYVNETTDILVETFPKTTGYQIKLIIDLSSLLLAGLALVIIYSVCVGKLIYYKLTANTGQGPTSLAVEARLGFQGFFLSSSLVILTFTFGYASLLSFSVSPLFFGFVFILAVSNFICGPFIVIGMSSIIRDHIKKLFKTNNTVVPIVATGKAKTNVQQ